MPRSLVVLGAGVGGLSAAIYGRLQGWDVLVLEQGDSPGGKAAGIAMPGYELDPGPSIIILREIYERLFRDAGRQMEDYLRFQKLDILTRVLFEGGKPLDIPADESEALRLLEGISRHDAQQLEKLNHRIARVEPLLWETIYDHPFDRPLQLLDARLARFALPLHPTTPYKQVVDGLFESDLMKAFFYGFPSYSGQSYHSKAPGGFLIPYYMFRHGVFFPEGGVRAIPAALARLAKELGVEFRFHAKVAGLEGASQVRAVRLESGESFEADAFISNIDPLHLAEMQGKTVSATPSYSYFTLHLGIRAQIPLEHHTLVVPKGFQESFEDLYAKGRFPSRPIVYLNSTAARDPNAAPAGCTNLFAVVTCPSLVPTCPWDDVRDYRGRVLETLREAGLEWNAEQVDFERVQQPRYFETAHGNYRGSLYGVAEAERLWGMFPTPNRDPRRPNLAFVGGTVQPGAGLPMAILSGRFGVEALRKALSA